ATPASTIKIASPTTLGHTGCGGRVTRTPPASVPSSTIAVRGKCSVSYGIGSGMYFARNEVGTFQAVTSIRLCEQHLHVGLLAGEDVLALGARLVEGDDADGGLGLFLDLRLVRPVGFEVAPDEAAVLLE